jgi:adenylate kinase family enzyme
MKRIMIIGSPGAGKSTFARKLADKTGLPLIHLDFYYHDTGKDYYNDKAAWQKRVEELTAQESWIIDGNYGNTMGERMTLAETIFYFDMPSRKAMWGVIKRRASAWRTVRDDMPAGWKEQTDWKFLRYVWTFRKSYAAATAQLLERNRNKDIVIFRNHRQAGAYLRVLN